MPDREDAGMKWVKPALLTPPTRGSATNPAGFELSRADHAPLLAGKPRGEKRALFVSRGVRNWARFSHRPSLPLIL
jgi:hypothetical protein